MARSTHRWIVDEIQSDVARIEVDGDRVAHLPSWVLPSDVTQGQVLSVEHVREGARSTLTIDLDPSGTKASLERSREQAAQAVPRGLPGKIVL